MASLFIFAVMGVCAVVLLALTEGVVSVRRSSKPRAQPLRQPSLVLIPIEERRAQRLRFVGAERRQPHLAAIQIAEDKRKIA